MISLPPNIWFFCGNVKRKNQGRDTKAVRRETVVQKKVRLTAETHGTSKKNKITRCHLQNTRNARVPERHKHPLDP